MSPLPRALVVRTASFLVRFVRALPRRVGLGMLAVAAALLVLPPAAAAAQPSEDKPKLFADFGWAGRVEADRWSPVRLTIQGGLEPFSGAVIIDHPQDPTQRYAVTIPVTATPGRTTQTSAAVCLPPNCTEMTVRLVDARGRTVQQLAYSQSPSPLQLPMPEFAMVHDLLVAAVGNDRVAIGTGSGPAGPGAASVSLIESPLEDGMRYRGRLGASSQRTIPAADLPITWAPYESLALLAVEADAAETIDPRSLAAIREWVSGGGRLVVVASGPGSAWRSWLPPSPIGSVVTADEPVRGATPPELAGLLSQVKARPTPAEKEDDSTSPETAPETPSETAPETSPDTEPNTAPQPPPEPTATDADPAAPADADPESAGEREDPPRTIEPAPALQQRAFRLTELGAASGWSVRWMPRGLPSDNPTVAPPDAGRAVGDAGLLAEGPVGFGWVTIVGIDPRRAAAFPQDRATKAIWLSIVDTSLRQRIETSLQAQEMRWGGWNAWTQNSEARVAVLNGLVDTPGANPATFIVIAAAMFALALLIGPFDALVLRALRIRHRSWLTALAWIALATLAAYLAPSVTRTADTAVSRLSVVDILVPRTADLPADAPGELAWQTSVTGVFADKTMRGALVPAADEPAPPTPPVHPAPPAAPAAAGALPPAPPSPRATVPASWWRGFSALETELPMRRHSATLVAQQTLPDLGSLEDGRDPWGGWGDGWDAGRAAPGAASRGPRPIVGGSTMMPTALRTWTFRSFEDQARVAAPCTARIRGDGRERTIELAGLPAAATIVAAACRIGDSWHTLSFEPAGAGGEPGSGVRTARLGPPLETAPSEWAYTPLNPNDPWALRRQISGIRATPMVAFSLCGAQSRALAAERLTQSGHWATVMIHVENLPSDVRLTGAPRGTRSMICRILTPIAPPPESGDPR